jgi:hypothetical protein
MCALLTRLSQRQAERQLVALNLMPTDSDQCCSMNGTAAVLLTDFSTASYLLTLAPDSATADGTDAADADGAPRYLSRGTQHAGSAIDQARWTEVLRAVVEAHVAEDAVR